MILLAFDVKIGYENAYMIEHGVEFPLDFLHDREYLTMIRMPDMPDEDILLEYAHQPGRLVADFKLAAVIKAAFASDYRPVFKMLGKPVDEDVCFPELFNMSSLRLVKRAVTKKQQEEQQEEQPEEADIICKNNKRGYDA